jgi:energy-coupling factor transporter ATP-binding protein EcfA2
MDLTSSLSSLAVSGLARIGPIVFRKLARRSRIDAAWKAGRANLSHSDDAMADLEIMLVNEYGGITESLDRFLRALESSGVITSLMEDAVSKNLRNETKVQFTALYNLHFSSDDVRGTTLLEKMYLAFQVSLDGMSADPVLALLIRHISERVASKLGDLEVALDGIESALRGYSLIDLAPSLDRIAKCLNSEYKINWVETNKGRKQVSLDKIYIPGRVKPRREDSGVKALMQSALAGVYARDVGRRHNNSEREDLTVGFVDFQKHFRRVVVLGDPGGGKSTLCQYLCLTLSNQYLLSNKYTHKQVSEIEPQSVKIPIRVVLRSFELARSKSPQISILDYIVAELVSSSGQEAKIVRASVLYGLEFGLVVLAFDGLDEILAVSRRREYVDIVRQFCDRFPLCPVVVTSRVVGYDDAPLPDDFEQVILEKLDQPEISTYVTRFLQHICGRERDEAERLAANFLEQTNENARDLRANPLMLGLMTFLFNAKGDVPGNRPEIYKECAMLMFERWDQNRSILADIPSGFDMLHLFGSVASRIYGNAELEEGVSATWLEEACRQYFSTVYENRAKAFDSAKKIVKFLAGRSWVLSEVGPDQYKYTHRTFMEYFFAQQLAEEYESVRELLQLLLPKIRRREWDVIAHLSLQIKTFRSPKRTSDAVISLQDDLRSAAGAPSELHAISDFVANSMAYMIPTENEVRGLVERVVATTVPVGVGDGYGKVARTWRSLANAHAERRTFVRGVLPQVLLSEFTRTDSIAERMVIALAVTAPDLNISSIPASWFDGVFLPAEVGHSARNLLQKPLYELTATSPALAFVYIDWFEADLERLLEHHGVGFLARDPRPVPPRAFAPVSPPLTRMLLDAAGFSALSRAEFLASNSAKLLKTLGARVGHLTLANYSPLSATSPAFVTAPICKRALTRCSSDLSLLRGLLIVIAMSGLHAAIAGESGRKRKEAEGSIESRTPAFYVFADESFRASVERYIAKFGTAKSASFDFWFEACAKFDSA